MPRAIWTCIACPSCFAGSSGNAAAGRRSIRSRARRRPGRAPRCLPSSKLRSDWSLIRPSAKSGCAIRVCRISSSQLLLRNLQLGEVERRSRHSFACRRRLAGRVRSRRQYSGLCRSFAVISVRLSRSLAIGTEYPRLLRFRTLSRTSQGVFMRQDRRWGWPWVARGPVATGNCWMRLILAPRPASRLAAETAAAKSTASSSAASRLGAPLAAGRRSSSGCRTRANGPSRTPSAASCSTPRSPEHPWPRGSQRDR